MSLSSLRLTTVTAGLAVLAAAAFSWACGSSPSAPSPPAGPPVALPYGSFALIFDGLL